MTSKDRDITNDPGFNEILRAIKKIEEPAFSYILRLPWNDVENLDAELQRYLKGGIWANMLQTKHIWEKDYKDQDPSILYTTHYAYTLATMAYWAVERTFRHKQQTTQPQFDSFIQVELSSTIHIHLVLSGRNLTKYTAKNYRLDLAHNFFNQIEQRLKEEMGATFGEPEWAHITEPITAARRDTNRADPKHCSILQYKSRRGDLFSCRVNPQEIIKNYFLPKNLKMNYYSSAEDTTPPGNWFAITGKTYAMTLINDRFIDPHFRRALVEKLEEVYNAQSSDPVFGGDFGGELPKVTRASWSTTAIPGGRMNKREALNLDLMNRAFEENLLTYEDLVDKHPDLVLMIESQTGGARQLEQVLNMAHVKITQKFNALTYIQKQYPDAEVEPENKVFKLLNLQGYNPWQVGHWVCCVLNKEAGKQNTICCFGPASTGKTNLVKAIAHTVKLYGCVNHQNKQFIFNDCAGKLVVWWEEGLMHSDWVEQAKCCLGGTTFRIDRKHKDSQIMYKTPVLISTNNNIYECAGSNYITSVHSKPLKERIVQLNFMKALENTFGEISVKECADWLVDCSRLFECTLQGFLKKWELNAVTNDFPLGKLCDSHSQDFTLHENGLCLSCGGYLPLTVDLECTGADSSDEGGKKTQSQILQTSLLRNRAIWLKSRTDNYISLFLTGDGSSSTSDSDSGAPRRKRRKLDEPHTIEEPTTSLESVRRELESFASPPENESDQIYWRWLQAEEKRLSASKQEETTPTEWGEMLGIIEQGEGQEPVTLHCFENIPDSESETEP